MAPAMFHKPELRSMTPMLPLMEAHLLDGRSVISFSRHRLGHFAQVLNLKNHVDVKKFLQKETEPASIDY
jgi:hypothetical protein